MIWFDLDNSPHIPVFRPIFKELTKRNEDYYVTARDFAQTKELLQLWAIDGKVVGKHGGKHRINKLINLLHRGLQLKLALRNKDISLAVSHGSRTQLITSFLSNINAVWLLDYEYTEVTLANKIATYILMPAYIPSERLQSAGFNMKKVIKYQGFKEELYLRDFKPDCSFREKLAIDKDTVLVVFRPPSLSANYHNHRSENLLIEGLTYFNETPNTVCLIVNRTNDDKELILSRVKSRKNIRFLDKPVDGLQLLFAADIAISGGGTMNREAALLGTKTYSIFTGKRPYLDDFLAQENKLKFISNISDFKKIPLDRSEKKIPDFNNKIAEEITDILLSLN